MVQILTIHIFKDDWMRRTTHQLVFNKSQFKAPDVKVIPSQANTQKYFVA